MYDLRGKRCRLGIDAVFGYDHAVNGVVVAQSVPGACVRRRRCPIRTLANASVRN